MVWPSRITRVPGGTETNRSAPACPWRALPWPWPPLARAVVHQVAERREVDDLLVGDQQHTTAAAAVAAVRAAARDLGLTPEGHAAHPAVATLHVDLSSIGEGHRRTRPIPTQRAAGSSGCTKMRRPLRPVVNSMRPVTVAKIV